MTHTPFRSWRPVCTQARGGGAFTTSCLHGQESRDTDGFRFLKCSSESRCVRYRTNSHWRSGADGHASCNNFMERDRYGLPELKRFIFDTGHTAVYLQTNREPSWVGVSRKETPGLRRRGAPAGSSASRGSIERHLQALLAHARKLRLSLASRL